jgi:UDP:flavonoid glycosyltransferase YjiC (YdhE family)
VVCNSGFELISECLHWGKPVLTKPLHGQMEQLSNALALEQLGYASRCNKLSISTLHDWLEAAATPAARRFPDVAAALAGWLAGGCRDSAARLVESLWPRRTGAPTSTVAHPPLDGDIRQLSAGS